MTATIRLISFERVCVYPAIRDVKSHITPTEESFSSTWYVEIKCYWHDNYMFNSYLSRITGNFYMATLRVEYLDLARDFRYKGVTSLRSYLEDTLSIDIFKVISRLLDPFVCR